MKTVSNLPGRVLTFMTASKTAALLTLLTFAVCGAAFGTTYHVATTGDDTKSGLSSTNAWRTIRKACDASAPNDEIIMHGGTYTFTGQECADPCALDGCGHAASGRIGTIIPKNGQYWHWAGTDGQVVLDLNRLTTKAWWAGRGYGSGRNSNQRVRLSGGTTLGVYGIKIINPSNPGPEDRAGILWDANGAYRNVYEGIHEVIDWTCEGPSCGIGVYLNGVTSPLVQNVKVEGTWSNCIWIQNAQGPAAGGTIHDITCVGTGYGGMDQRAFLLEGMGPTDNTALSSVWAMYNIRILQSTAPHGYRFGFYPREVGHTVYIWNTFITGEEQAVHTQEDAPTTCHPCASERIFFFNNTITNSGEGLHNYTCVSVTARNNIFSDVTNAYYQGSNLNCQAVGGATDENAKVPWDNNLMYKSNGNTCYMIFASGPTCFNIASPPAPDLAHGTGNIENRNPLLDANGKLLAGSPAIDAGTNNPIGQGPGICLVTDNAGRVSDCSLDIDGNRRGAGNGWDIGIDEMTGVVSGPPPLPPTGLQRTDTR